MGVNVYTHDPAATTPGPPPPSPPSPSGRDLTPVPGLGDCHPPARPARTIPYLAKEQQHKEKLSCQQTSSPCSRSARCPGTAKATSSRTTPAPGTRPARSPDWTGTRSPPSVYAFTGVNPDGTTRYEPIYGWKAITRSDTGAVLSINKESYTVIDHGEMGEIVEAVLAQPNVRWETAGVLDGGRSVWCLALLDEPITLPGDDSATLPYLAITNRHDGTGACALRATAVRIVCANTFRAAELEGERTGTTFSFIHKSSWRSRIEEARRAVTGAQAEMRRYSDLARELLAIPITPVQRELFITEFIPKPPRA